MKINMADDDYFPVGMLLSCTTCTGQKLQGEVMAFDYDTKVVVLKSPVAGGKSGTHDVRLINFQYVSDFKVIKEPAEVPAPLSNLNFPKITSRVRSSVDEKLRQVNYIGVGVTPQAQRLFHHITKTISDVRWDGQTILVLDSVRITPPYQSEACLSIKEKDARKADQKLVEKYHRDEANLAAFLSLFLNRILSSFSS